MSHIATLAELIEAHGLALRTGGPCDPETIHRFEESFDVRFPADLRAFYQTYSFLGSEAVDILGWNDPSPGAPTIEAVTLWLRLNLPDMPLDLVPIALIGERHVACQQCPPDTSLAAPIRLLDLDDAEAADAESADTPHTLAASFTVFLLDRLSAVSPPAAIMPIEHDAPGAAGAPDDYEGRDNPGVLFEVQS